MRTRCSASRSFMSLFPMGPDAVQYRRIPAEGVVRIREAGQTFLCVPGSVLTKLAETAFHDAGFFFSKKHLQDLAAIIGDRRASANDRFVARALLENAVIASDGILPLCQDTGTATIMAWRGYNVLSKGDDAKFLSRGVQHAYARNCFRYSQLAPASMFAECNTGDNLPAQIDVHAVPGNEYRFLFITKGGGSANKTCLYQESKALLADTRRFQRFLEEKIRGIGVAACPPYHLAVVIGGSSPERTLQTVKLATAGALDTLATRPDGLRHAYRDQVWERRLLTASRRMGLGAQFGGRHFAMDVRVVRMPRHAGSLPIGIGVSCNAHRNIKAKITAAGVFLEKLETNPVRFLDDGVYACAGHDGMHVNLDLGIDKVVSILSRCRVGARLALSGTLIVARDIAHERILRILKKGRRMPDYFQRHAVYYAGPSKTPHGLPSGSFGPTTAQRMDSYVAEFMKHGASRIMLAKGNRSPAVADACRKYNGFYLGTIGGAAALVASRHIESSEMIAFPELGMEAVYKLKVRNLPAFIIGDNRGNTLY